ncbi:hypothetical protein MLD38_031680 [Melastoma candidum]|uniref:Uncharacterized protein n=1 Tax=Melastoma candidum TaxID=119954 RepID=A0ACB9MRX3_9MYRT|nr:hypothetical protein MLD38_031680 [Melastoma candidum]
MGFKFTMTLSTALLAATAVFLAITAQPGDAVTFCGVDDDGQTVCKPSIMGPTPADPAPECCKVLTALSAEDLNCLCGYKSSPLLPALGIDPELVMGTVKKCGITPPEGC